MKNTKIELLYKLAGFVQAWGALDEAWQEYQQEHDDSALVTNFPFDMSFDEKGRQVITWAQEAAKDIAAQEAPKAPVIPVCHPASFEGDWGGATYEGYTDGDTWNGWECPRFPKETADALLAAHLADGFPAHYDAESDSYFFQMTQTLRDPEDVERFDGHDVLVNGETIHVYAIGAWNWCWDMARNEEEEED